MSSKKKETTKPKGKEKEEKPEPQTFKFKSWSLAMEERGLFINGVIEEDKKKVDFHTDVIDKIISEKEVQDREGNTILLEGKFNRQESIDSGLSEEFVDLFKDGFFQKNFKGKVDKEKKALILRIKMRTVEWTDMAFVGIEYDNLKGIYDEPFEFPDLDDQMTDGVLSHQKYPLYCFMGAQPHYLGGQGSSTKMLQVPYIVVIDCEVPPPNKIAYHSIQLGVNKVISFEKQKDFASFAWEPYIPSRLNKTANTLPKPQVHTLKWTARPTKINNLEEKDKHYIEYLLPYILLPQLVEQEKKPEDGDTKQVDFKFKFEGKTYDIVFDKEIDTLSEFIPDFLEEKKLKGKCEEEVVKKALQDAFKKAREKKLQTWERRQKALENLTEKEREGLRKIKLYKFYPSHPDIRKPEEIANNKINQYFGNADKVFFPEPPPVDEKRLKRIQKQEEELQKKMKREMEREKSPKRRRSPAPKRKRSPAPKKKSPAPKKKTSTSSKKRSSPKRRRKDESSSDDSEQSESESSSSEEVKKKKTPPKKKTTTKKTSSPKKKTPVKKSKKEESEDEDSDKSSEEKPKKKTTKKNK